MNLNEEPTPSTSSSSARSNGFGSGAKKATKIKRKKNINAVPFSRVLNVMKSHPRAEKAKVTAIGLISHATELFIKDLIKTCYQSSPEALTYGILAMAIAQSGNKYLKETVPKTITYREYLRLKKEREAKKKDEISDEEPRQEDQEHGDAADVNIDEEKAEDNKDKDNEDKEAEENDVILDEDSQQEDQEHGYAAGVDQEMAEDKKDKKIDKKKEDNGDDSKEKEESIYYDHFVESIDYEDKNTINLEEFGEICEESIVAYEEAIQLFH